VEGSEGNGGAAAIASRSEEVVGEVGIRGSGYEECIGAKKYLVLGLLSHTGPERSNSVAIG
jgi:hypothetical protein